MSKTESEPDLTKYRTAVGKEEKISNIASDDHALKKRFGDGEDAKRIKYDNTTLAQRIADWYDKDSAAIREYLANAETACIRRARNELVNLGIEPPEETRELFELAEEEAGYEPVIEVTHRMKPESDRLVIEDNGVGITPEEYQVVRRVGYSASHNNGSETGMFGLGMFSIFTLTGIDNPIRLYTRSFPGPEREEESFSVLFYATNLEYLDAIKEDYGTRFEVPSFDQGTNISVSEKVEDFSEGLRVPVIFREFDENGRETANSDDFTPRMIEDDYPDESFVVTYENEFFKAVMSPDTPENRYDQVTYNLSMPIRRNLESHRTNDRFEATDQWDFRGKAENGPIVAVGEDDDESLVGMVPVKDSKIDRLPDDQLDDKVPMSEVPDSAIVMPEPASSRDSYKSGNDRFWKHVSRKLQEAYREAVAEEFGNLGSFDDFRDMDTEEKRRIIRGYKDFGPNYGVNDPSNIQEAIEDNLDVTLDEDTCEKLDRIRDSVLIVSRNHNQPHTIGATSNKKIWKIIDEYDEDHVYVGKSINERKAKIAWELSDDSVIVRVKDTNKYDEYQDLWGWNLLKEIPTSNLKEKLPDLDDDAAERLETTTSDTTSNSSSSSSSNSSGRNPKSAYVKVRSGYGKSKYYTKYKVSDIVENLKNDDPISAGRFSGRSGDRLIILDQNNTTARDVSRASERGLDIVAARVPKYVYEYLKDFDKVYESKDEAYDDMRDTEVTLSDGSTENLEDLTSDDLLIIAGPHTRKYFGDEPEKILGTLGIDEDDYTRVTMLDGSELNDALDATTDATVVKTSNGSTQYSEYTYNSKKFKDFIMDTVLDDVDKSSELWDLLIGAHQYTPEGERLYKIVTAAESMDLL